jgi:hypothetical protein
MMNQPWARLLTIGLYSFIFVGEISGLTKLHSKSVIEILTLMILPKTIPLLEVLIFLTLGIILILQKPKIQSS